MSALYSSFAQYLRSGSGLDTRSADELYAEFVDLVYGESFLSAAERRQLCELCGRVAAAVYSESKTEKR